MEIKKIKCPICGNEEFVKIEKPYHEGFETYIDDYTEYYGCTNCEYILRFGKGLAKRVMYEEFFSSPEGKKWAELNKKIEELIKNIDSNEKLLTKLRNESKNENRTIKRDKEIKEQIAKINKEKTSLKKELENLRTQLAEIDSKRKYK